MDARWGARAPMHEPELLAGFKPRPTDVLITTAPKCGTTWMQQILHQVRTGGDDDYTVIGEVVPWLEAAVPGETTADQLARYEALPDFRVFKTHCTAEQTPGIDLVRLVMTSRDPRDACVSMFHHKNDFTDEARSKLGMSQPGTLDEHVKQWLAFGSWFRNVQSWWPERNRPNLLWLRYEDLVADLPTAIDRIARFLDRPLDEAQRARVLELSSFAWMRQNADRFTRLRASQASAFKPGGFIRKGGSTGRVELEPHHVDAILARTRELPADCRAFLGLS
jgi:hypothetical protein